MIEDLKWFMLCFPRRLIGILFHKRRLKLIRRYYSSENNPFEISEDIRWSFEKAFS